MFGQVDITLRYASVDRRRFSAIDRMFGDWPTIIIGDCTHKSPLGTKSTKPSTCRRSVVQQMHILSVSRVLVLKGTRSCTIPRHLPPRPLGGQAPTDPSSVRGSSKTKCVTPNPVTKEGGCPLQLQVKLACKSRRYRLQDPNLTTKWPVSGV